MAKFLLFILLVFFGYTTSFAQVKARQSLDQLHESLSKTKTDTARVSILLEIASEHFELSNQKIHQKSVDSAFLFVGKASKLSESLNFQKGIASSNLLLSRLYKKKGQYVKSEEAAEKAIALFKKQNLKSDLADAYLALMSAKEETSTIPEGIVLVEKAIELYKQEGKKKEAADCMKDLGFLNMSQGKMELGQDQLKQSLVLYKAIGYEEVQRIYSLIAISYNVLGNYKEALDNGLKAVKLVERFNDTSEDAAEIYNYVGIIYTGLKDLQMANEYFQKAHKIAKGYNNMPLIIMLETNIVQTLMNLNRAKEAVVFLKEMEKKYSSLPPSAQQMLISRCMLAYTSLKEFKNAEKYVNIAMKMSNKMAIDDYNQLGLYPGIVKYHFQTKKYGVARKYANNYKILSEKIKDVKSLKDIHRMLFQLDSVESKFDSALANFKLERKYSDSLLGEMKQKQLAELQVQYDTEKKDKNLLLKEQSNILLKKQGELQESKLSEANLMKNISLGSIVLLLIIVSLLYSRYRIKQRTNNLLEAQKKEIKQKNAALEKLLKEKEWLLKEIHHRVKNNLQMVMSLLNTQSHYLKDDAAMVAIRNSQHRIHSMSLIHKKLYQSDNVIAINMEIYIQELIEYFRLSFDTGQRIRFIATIEPVELDTSQAVPLGLIINEAITNSIKHAFPDNLEGTISVSLQLSSENRYKLIIKDDGIGIPDDFVQKKFTSLGMRLIKGLSDDLDAKLDIENNNGLAISIEFAYDEKILNINSGISELSA